MPTADEVVVEFEARVGKYEADVRRAQREFERSTGAQQARMQQFERQMRASSGQISNTLKGLAGTFAAAFSVRELTQLADSFTRIQNNMRVAGLEGENLARVQESLLDISQRYGADLEGMSEVFLRASMAQNELGASTQQIIQLNEIIAASLKVTGTSAQQASGALLQLGQALGSGVVRAQEFNSILEGALPLAQAAARGIDGMEGSVSKLRAAVADGQITSRQFFEGVLRGGVQTLNDAEKATLTLSGGFTALSSELTVYFGEADKANGVSAALGEALGALADNLGTIIPALATVATGLGVGYVKNVVAARTATLSLGAAAATTRTALLAAFGGPVGIGITAVAAAIYFAATRMETASAAAERLKNETEQLTAENDQMEARLKAAGVAVNDFGGAATGAARNVDGLTRSMEAAIRRAKELEDQVGLTRVRTLQSEIVEAQNERLAAQHALRGTQNSILRGSTIEADQQEAFEQAVRREEALRRQLRLFTAGMRAGVNLDEDTPAPAQPGTPAPAVASTSGRTSAGATGPDAAEIERRFLDELDSIRSRIAAAEGSMATSAEERAELELRQLENAHRQTLRSLDADADYSDAQKERVRQALETLALAEREAIEFSRRMEEEREAADLAEERYRAQEDALRLQYDLASTEADRRRIALEMLAAEDAYLRSKLEAIEASETATEAERERARIAREGLDATAGSRRRVVDRHHQGPLGDYIDDATDTATRVEWAVVREMEAVNQGITDALAESLGTDNQFVKDMFSIFLDQVIFRPLAESLRDAGGVGGGGLLGGLLGGIGSIFGRDIGGPVRGGVPYLVGERGPELLIPQQNGVVVPNHRLTAQSAPTVISSPQFDLRGAVVTEQLYADMERISRTNAAKAGARAYQQSMRDAPSAMEAAQRYGR